MSIQFEDDLRLSSALEIAGKMLLAARTAPKARGNDRLVLAVATNDDIVRISDKMREIGTVLQNQTFLRDCENILKAHAVVLFGTKIQSQGLKKCGMCGYGSCEEKDKHPEVSCVFDTGDLGIAIGSAVSVAADCRIDNRIMYSVGQAVIEMGLLGSEVKIAYGIPLCIASKNPFFDR
jgi:uncharacterized ferredoxin-like protein